ncbi:hypothetical protein BDN70DRAFT_152270 [Pholiota conissans]|uniref:Cyclin N-terminal domain-containing protein n=1 Tax=Pholiota conissans TaxID=109636 RepID=A0A9P5YZB1_9AGAR|nr:hypothetical protein BDN70DRAFT_152270 [Pholiota conissans]
MAIPQVHRSHPSPRTTPPPLPPHVLARAYTNHIIDIFGSARYPYPAPRSLWQSSLPSYIAYILSASGLPMEVGMSAMVLLFRYKDAMPGSVAYGEDAARLWVAAYVVAAKVVSDVDVDLEMRRREVDCGGGGGGGGEGGQGIAHIPRRGMDFWFHAALQRFSVDELRNMELELCRILHWDVQVSGAAFECFRRMLVQGG